MESRTRSRYSAAVGRLASGSCEATRALRRRPLALALLLGMVALLPPMSRGQEASPQQREELRQRRRRLRRLREEGRLYEHGADSRRKEGVPRGKLTTHVWKDSKVFPGTIRRYSIYVPAQYDAKKPAALMVFQDGHAYVKEDGDFRVPVVFDNLIHAGDMPVTIGVFVDPGFKRSELPPEPGWRPQPENRSFEYDSLGPTYSKFLLEEILPEVEKRYNITDDPGGRAIAGISSGGICAFTVAWERPDRFRKVMSHVGSFADIRGGHRYPEIVLASPHKPLRIFLQDGRQDNRSTRPGWNWVTGNLRLAAALEEKVYDYRYVLGDGAHNGNHGGVILPDSLRWLWRDYKLPEDRLAEPPPRVDPEGTWTWTRSFGGNRREFALELRVSDGKLTGSYRPAARPGQSDAPEPVTIDNVKLDGKQLSFSVKNRRGGREVTVSYEGEIRGDTIAGWSEVEFGGNVRESEWEAKRVRP